jgi:alpha-tubulin suppressor-like RCC1 family protein
MKSIRALFAFSIVTLWATGGNGYGHYAKPEAGDTGAKSTFAQVLTDVATVSTSWDAGTFEGFSLAIKKDGTVWGIGEDGWGVFGRSDVSGLEKWTQLFHH